jgi:hypothetical protein
MDPRIYVSAREWVWPKCFLFIGLEKGFGGTRAGKGLTNKNTIMGPLFYA